MPDEPQSEPPPCRRTAIIRGALGFAAVSTAAFSIWAFGSGLFSGFGGEGALYAAIAAAFIGFSGPALHRLVPGGGIGRFYRVFGPAFAAYAVVWSAAWFVMKSALGEWIGAAAGSLAFVGVLAVAQRRPVGFVQATAGFFALHTVGYFAGGQSMDLMVGLARKSAQPEIRKAWVTAAKLSWGVFYGLGFGAGLGLALSTLLPRTHSPFPVRSAAPSTDPLAR
jgi:hypothetical protein